MASAEEAGGADARLGVRVSDRGGDQLMIASIAGHSQSSLHDRVRYANKVMTKEETRSSTAQGQGEN